MTLNGLFPERARPQVMGILNVSSDSFFAATADLDNMLKRADHLVCSGVDCLDVGGEATNPSTVIESPTEAAIKRQSDCVVAAVRALRAHFDVPISIDTSYPLIMREGIEAGASMINDQRALSVPGSKEVVIESGVPVVLMHSQLVKQPDSTESSVVKRVKVQWCSRLDALLAAGLQRDQVIFDPGFGQGHYGKSLADNYQLLAELSDLVAMGYPLLVGWSRKSMIGDVSGGCPPAERLPGSLAAAVIAAEAGVGFLRVHDVAETVQALAVFNRMTLSRQSCHI